MLRKALSLVICSLLVAILVPSSVADETSPDKNDSSGNGNIGEVHILIETRGNSPPTQKATSLPYNGSATISSYVYTNRYLTSTSGGYLYTSFSGSVPNLPTTAKLELYDLDTDERVATKSMGLKRTWPNVNKTRSGLEPNHGYYWKIKNAGGGNPLTFTLKCSTSAF